MQRGARWTLYWEHLSEHYSDITDLCLNHVYSYMLDHSDGEIINNTISTPRKLTPLIRACRARFTL